MSSDFIMDFYSRVNRPSGLCRIRTLNSDKEVNVVIITDIGDFNKGASITNSIEKIALKLKATNQIDDGTVRLEHCETSPFNEIKKQPHGKAAG